jgi:hypothetical protein
VSLATGDLTTPANAQAYVAAFAGMPVSSPIIVGLVTRISRWIESKLNRSLLVPKAYSQQFNGSGTTSLVLPNWPVVGNALTSMTIGGAAIQLAPQANNIATFTSPFGYRIQPWNGLPPGIPAVVELVGGAFYYPGNQNVVVNYTAGYQVSDELVPTGGGTTYLPITPYGIWATDAGVAYTASGALLTSTTGSPPAAGTYVPPSPNAATPVLTYLFNAADVVAGLSLSYGFIPADLEQVCLELIAERASYRSRIGVRSQSLASQESMTYDLDGLPAYAKAMLMPYVSVLPPAMGANV